MSGIDDLQVLVVATGTKCVDGSKLSSNGQALNDSHAEVLARRAFKKFLLEQIKRFHNQESSILIKSETPPFLLTVKPGISKYSLWEIPRFWLAQFNNLCIMSVHTFKWFHLWSIDAMYKTNRRAETTLKILQQLRLMYNCSKSEVQWKRRYFFWEEKYMKITNSWLGLSFHLYISTSPCGDARIYNMASPGESATTESKLARGVLRSKIECGEGTIPVNNMNSVQTWDGVLAGERLCTMSCSDKVSVVNLLHLSLHSVS